MFGLFKKNPAAKLRKEIERLGEQSVHLQRNGKLADYAKVMTQIDALSREADALENKAAETSGKG